MGEGVRDGRGESELADYVTVCYTGTEAVSERSSQNAGYHQRRVNCTDSNVSTIHQLLSSLLTQVLLLPLSHGVRGAEVSLPHDAGAGHVRLCPLQMLQCQSTTIQGSRFSIQLWCSNNVSGFSVGCCITREEGYLLPT